MKRSTCAITLAVLCLAAAGTAAAEGDEKVAGRWYNSLEAGLNLTQSAYSDNWKGGENGALAWTAIMNGSAERLYENDLNWYNSLKLRFGQLHQQNKNADGDKVWNRPEKSEDKIDLETILRLSKGWHLDPYVSGRAETQFLDVSDDAGRDVLLNPATFKESAGVSRKFKDTEDTNVLARLGLTARQNYRREFVDGMSEETTNEIAHDGGVEFQADWSTKLSEKRVLWVGKLSVYKPFAWSKASVYDDISADSLTAVGVPTDVKDLTTSFDLGWENTFTTQISKWLSLNMYLEFVYDQYDNSVVPIVNDDGGLKNGADITNAIRKKGQFKQSFSIGITYRFL